MYPELTSSTVGCTPARRGQRLHASRTPCIRSGKSKLPPGLDDLLRLIDVRYLFPTKPSAGVFDLTGDDRPFYYNPHSGELSLKFPKADNCCRGGILA